MTEPIESPVMPAGVRLPAGYDLRVFDTIDSTNAEALRGLSTGTATTEIIWAKRQTGGRGRRGRSWHSPPGNLYVTIVVPVPEERPVPQLAFVAAVGAGEAAGSLLGAAPSLAYKWPNDLMLGGRKLGGILVEAEGAMAAVGIGLNAVSCPSGVNATSLGEAGISITLHALFETVCLSFDRWYRIWCRKGFAPIRERWQAAAFRLGDPLEVRFPDGTASAGCFRGIDRTGALILQRADGTVQPVATGEVSFASA